MKQNINPNQQIESRKHEPTDSELKLAVEANHNYLPKIHPNYEQILSGSKLADHYFPFEGELIKETIEHIIHNISTKYNCGVQNIVVTFEESEEGNSYAGFYVVKKQNEFNAINKQDSTKDQFTGVNDFYAHKANDSRGLKRNQSVLPSKSLIERMKDDFFTIAEERNSIFYSKHSNSKKDKSEKNAELFKRNYISCYSSCD